MLLQTALLWKLLSTGFTLKPPTVLLLDVVLKLLLLLEPALAVVALEEVRLILFVLVHVEQPGLGQLIHTRQIIQRGVIRILHVLLHVVYILQDDLWLDVVHKRLLSASSQLFPHSRQCSSQIVHPSC